MKASSAIGFDEAEHKPIREGRRALSAAKLPRFVMKVNVGRSRKRLPR
jgi:hypothetical protein